MEATQSHAVEKNYLLNLIKGLVFIIDYMFIEYRLTSESVLSSETESLITFTQNFLSWC